MSGPRLLDFRGRQPSEALSALAVVKDIVEHQTQVFFRPDGTPVLILADLGGAALECRLRVRRPLEIGGELAHS